MTIEELNNKCKTQKGYYIYLKPNDYNTLLEQVRKIKYNIVVDNTGFEYNNKRIINMGEDLIDFF